MNREETVQMALTSLEAGEDLNQTICSKLFSSMPPTPIICAIPGGSSSAAIKPRKRWLDIEEKSSLARASWILTLFLRARSPRP